MTNSPAGPVFFNPEDSEFPDSLSTRHLDKGGAGRVIAFVVAGEVEWAPHAALAVAKKWAQEGVRVFLADLDLDDPQLHTLLGVPNHEGISDAFEFGSSVQRVAQRIGGGSFFFAPAGTPTGDTTRIFAHRRWSLLAQGFDEAGAALLLFLPVGIPGAAEVLCHATDVVWMAPESQSPEDQLPTTDAPILAWIAPPADWVAPSGTTEDRVGDEEEADFGSAVPDSVTGLGATETSSLDADPILASPSSDDDFGDPVSSGVELENPFASDVDLAASDLAASDVVDSDVVDSDVTAKDVAAGDVSLGDTTAEISLPEPIEGLEADRAILDFDEGGQGSDRGDDPFDGVASFEPVTPDDSPLADPSSRRKPQKRSRAVPMIGLLAVVAAAGYYAWDQGWIPGAGASGVGGGGSPTVMVEPPTTPVGIPETEATPLGEEDGMLLDAGRESLGMPIAPLMGFSLVVLSESSAEAARLKTQELSEQDGNLLFIVTPSLVNGKTWYRVMAGPAEESEEIAGIRRAVAATGKVGGADDWFIRRTNLAFLHAELTTIDSADVRASELREMGIAAYVLEVEYSNGGALFRVYSGGYANAAEAAPLADQITSAGETAQLTNRIGRLPR